MPLLFDEQTYQPQQLRAYQNDAIDAVTRAWKRGVQSPLVAAATGSGKTTIIAELFVRLVDPQRQRALLVAHTEELITQPRDRIANQFDGALAKTYTERYAPGIGIVMGKDDQPDARIVVATRQSLHKARLEKVLLYGKIDYLVIDEAHHAKGENTYDVIIQTVRAHNPAVKVVGFTATPEDESGALWDEIVYEWLIPDGIKGGYLVPPTRIKVKTNVDLSKVKSAHGDYNLNSMVSVLKTKNWAELAYKAYVQHIAPGNRLTLAFLPSVEMSRQLSTHLKSQGVAAGHIDGMTEKDERRRILAEYRAGRIRVLCNYGVLTEGFDVPETGAILFARPTRSKTLFTQIIGRVLRPYPGKSDGLIVDLTVEDTKALETGSLICKMTICEGCGVEHYAALRACPACGFVRSAKKRYRDGAPVEKDELSAGDQLIANYESVFNQAFAAWYVGADGFFSCNLSFESGYYLIAPPLEDNYFRLIYVPKDRKKPTQVLNRNEDLSALMLDADARVRQQANAANDKNAPWRDHPATEAQLNWLKSLGVDAHAGLSKGAASQLITHHTAIQRMSQG